MLFYNELFKSYRQSRCLTLEEIGHRIGVSKQTVQKWEKGIVKPRPDKVYALAEILNLSVVDISDLKTEKVSDMDNKELLERAKQYAFEHGWTIDKLVEVLNISKSTFFNWQAGKKISARGRVTLLRLTMPSAPETHADNIEDFRTSLINALIDSDLPPEALQKVLKIVRNHKKGE